MEKNRIIKTGASGRGQVPQSGGFSSRPASPGAGVAASPLIVQTLTCLLLPAEGEPWPQRGPPARPARWTALPGRAVAAPRLPSSADPASPPLVTQCGTRAFRRVPDPPVLRSPSPDFAVNWQTLKDWQGARAEDPFLRVPGPEPRARGGLGTTRWRDPHPIPQQHREPPPAHARFQAPSGEAPACPQGPQGQVVDFIVSTQVWSSKLEGQVSPVP